MQTLCATLDAIEKKESLHRLRLTCNGTALALLSLELAEYAVGTRLLLAYKPTTLLLAREPLAITTQNRLGVTVEAIERGEILASVALRFGEAMLESVCSVASLDALGLHVGERVVACINESELSIKGVCDADA